MTDDVVAVTDHGGKVSAARKPLHGPDRVARFMVGLVQKGMRVAGIAALPTQLNGAPAVLVFRPDGELEVAVILRIEATAAGERVAAISTVRNPDKLRAIKRRTALA